MMGSNTTHLPQTPLLLLLLTRHKNRRSKIEKLEKN